MGLNINIETIAKCTLLFLTMIIKFEPFFIVKDVQNQN